MTTADLDFTALDSLKEIAALADQAAPATLRALIDLYSPGSDAEHDPKLQRISETLDQWLQLGGLILPAMLTHEPDVVSAAMYSDGRPVTTLVDLGGAGTFLFVNRANPTAEPREETVRARNGRLFRVAVIDGQVAATPIGHGEADEQHL